MLTGRVDELRNGKVYGWAYNTENPGEHLVIRINFGPQVVASGVANLLRPDLPEAGVGDGDHAFEIQMPPNISSFQGLMIVAQSVKAGDIALPIASNDERILDDLFAVFSKRYEDALVALKQELDGLGTRTSEIEAAKASPADDLPASLGERLVNLEQRLEAAEVFLVRIDESLRKIAGEHAKKSRRRFLGIF